MFKGLPFSFLTVIFFNLIFWQIVIPIWHFPDEQAHFGQVAFRAEHGRVQEYQELSTNLEIVTAEELLGTKRDTFGNNLFTYNPDFKIDYSQTITGPHELQIESLSTKVNRQTQVTVEATRYPLLYYFLASQVYKLFNQSDLFARVYAVRFLSIVIFMATVFVSYKTSQLLFPQNRFLQISVTSLVAFFPMLIFASLGITSDTLYNLLFILLIYLISKMLFSKFDFFYGLATAVTFIAGYFTKPQFQIAWLLIAFALLIFFFRLPKTKKKLFAAFVIIGLLLLLPLSNLLQSLGSDFPRPNLAQLVRMPIIQEIGEFSLDNPQTNLTFPRHFAWTIKHTIQEVLPWYFGVFKWLSLTFPPIVYQIINRILLIALIGLLILFFKAIKNKKFSQQIKILSFFLYSSLAYFLAVTVFDWLFTRGHGFSFGIQGRYFFPTIVAHFSLIFFSLLTLTPKSYRDVITQILVVAMLVFNFFAMYFIASHYYDVSSFKTFVIQISQYKPEIFKGFGVILIIFILIISTAFFLRDYFKLAKKQAKISYEIV